MILFIIFILLGLTLGTGTMLAPALPTKHPRIAVCGIFSFGIVLSGSVFYGTSFGWDTLVVDYLWFALIISIFLGGTLTLGMQRIEDARAQGDNTLTEGWPGWQTLSLFAAWLGVLIIVFWQADATANLKDDANLITKVHVLQQSHDFSTLYTISDGENAPAVPALLAYLDHQLTPDTEEILSGLLITLYLLLAWQSFDLIREITQRDFFALGGIAIAAVTLLIFWLEYTTIVAFNFLIAFSFFAWRWYNHRHYFEGFAAAVCATAAMMTQITFIFPVVGVNIAWLVITLSRQPTFSPSYEEHPSLMEMIRRQTATAWGLIPLLTLIALFPWLSGAYF